MSIFLSSDDFWRFCWDFRGKKFSGKISEISTCKWPAPWIFDFGILTFWKNCYFYLYFWFLIIFTHSNILSQVLLWWLVKKFLCDMYCIPIAYQRIFTCQSVVRYPVILKLLLCSFADFQKTPKNIAPQTLLHTAVAVRKTWVIPRHRVGEVCFCPPLLWPRTFLKKCPPQAKNF